MENKGWHGVDLDGTLAHYDSWHGPEHIGAPIPKMIERVKIWLGTRQEVRIFTARVYAAPNNAEQQIAAAVSMLAIQDWCLENFGMHLPVTCQKDFAMIDLWDDRAVQVVPNTGETLETPTDEFLKNLASSGVRK